VLFLASLWGFDASLCMRSRNDAFKGCITKVIPRLVDALKRVVRNVSVTFQCTGNFLIDKVQAILEAVFWPIRIII
jgi:hypothetical protein